MLGRTPRSSVAAPRFGGTDLRPSVRTYVEKDIRERIWEKDMGERRFSRRVMAVHKTSILTNRGSRIAGSGCMTYVRTYVSIHALGCVQAVPVQPASPGADHEPGPRAAWAASGQGSARGSDKGSVQESVWAHAEHTVGYASGQRGAYGFGFGPGIGFGPGGCGFGPGGVGFGRGVAHAKGNICTLLYVRTYVRICFTYVRTVLPNVGIRTYVLTYT